jgi:hypothetical protein
MHPLVRNARSSVVDDLAVRPQNAKYDFARGLWLGPKGLLCEDPNHIPQSKKFDVETGEDQKGQ